MILNGFMKACVMTFGKALLTQSVSDGLSIVSEKKALLLLLLFFFYLLFLFFNLFCQIAICIAVPTIACRFLVVSLVGLHQRTQEDVDFERLSKGFCNVLFEGCFWR